MIEVEDMKSQEQFFANLADNLHVFEGCHNMLGVVPLTRAGYDGDKESWIKDERLRRRLVEWGIQINSDSVMVLTGDPLKADQQGYHVTMDVLEPRGGDGSDLGGLSTMCGNGVRAVAAYVKEFLPDIQEVTAMTRSGLRKIKIEKGSSGEDLFVVDMGEFSDKSDDLARYVKVDRVSPDSDGKYLDSEIPEEIRNKLEGIVDVSNWSIGINGDRNGDGKMDGEPHLVVEVPRSRVRDIGDLRRIAVAAGPIITKRLDLFPGEMNANFVVLDGVDEEGRFVIWNCTHERNLGDDADHSVTAACGTGSTVAGGLMFEKYVQDPTQIVLVKCTGGDLEIAKNGTTSLLMKGPAQRVE